MSAPQRPAEHEVEPLWASPPPEPSPRGWWWAAAVLMVAVAAGGLWVVFDQRRADAPAPDESTGPAPEEAANAVPQADAEPQPDRGPAVDPVLAELRATDRFLALAEHDRAREVEGPSGMEGAWALFRPAEGEYVNKDQLWDDVVGPIRDDALLAGEPYTDAIWDEEQPTDAYLPILWLDETTAGRGDVFTFAVRFVDSASGQPVERIHAVLIRSRAEGIGGIAARMGPVDVRREDAADFPAAADLWLERVWSWVEEQPVEGSR